MMLPDPALPPALQLPPAMACSEAPVTEDQRRPSEVTVQLVSLEGATCSLTCRRHATLRSLQRELCSLFGKNFPHMAASVCIGESAFSDFDHVPFRLAADHQTVNIVFSRQQTDPSGYDFIHRSRGDRVSLDDECAWEQLVASGETDLSLEEWCWANRCK